MTETEFERHVLDADSALRSAMLHMADLICVAGTSITVDRDARSAVRMVESARIGDGTFGGSTIVDSLLLLLLPDTGDLAEYLRGALSSRLTTEAMGRMKRSEKDTP